MAGTRRNRSNSILETALSAAGVSASFQSWLQLYAHFHDEVCGAIHRTNTSPGTCRMAGGMTHPGGSRLTPTNCTGQPGRRRMRAQGPRPASHPPSLRGSVSAIALYLSCAILTLEYRACPVLH